MNKYVSLSGKAPLRRVIRVSSTLTYFPTYNVGFVVFFHEIMSDMLVQVVEQLNRVNKGFECLYISF